MPSGLRHRCQPRIEELRQLSGASSEAALKAFDDVPQPDKLVLTLARLMVSAEPRARRVIAATILSVDPSLVLVFEALSHMDEDDRASAFEALSLEGEDAVGSLLPLLLDDRPGVAMLAEQWLLAVGESAVEPLLDRLSGTDALPEQVQKALQALADQLSVVQVSMPSGETRTVSYRQLNKEDVAMLVSEGASLTVRSDRDTFGVQAEQGAAGRAILGRLALLQRLDVALFQSFPADRDRPLVEEVESIDPAERCAPFGERARYTDIEFFEGHIYPSEMTTAGTRLPDASPLCAGGLYTVGVTIRARRIGVGAQAEALEAVRNPRTGEGMLSVYVVLASNLPGVSIVEPLLPIAWPYDQDSDTALFRLEIAQLPSSEEAVLEIRLYDQALDLLSIVKAHVSVVANASEEGRAKWLEWPERAAPAMRRDELEAGRLMAIHVRLVNQGYEFDFLLKGKDGAPFRVPVRTQIKSQDLVGLLSRIRNFWTKLAIGNYAKELSVSRVTFEQYLRELRDLGQDAWTLLFGGRTADQLGASETIGEILQKATLQDDGLIQIAHADQTADFIFPWALLHPPVADDSPVDPMQFWGVRFRIEQVTRGPTVSQLSDEPVQVLFAMDPSFENSIGHDKRIAQYASLPNIKVVLNGPLTSESSFLSGLTTSPAPHLVYLFCHGYAASGQLLKPDGVKVLRKTIEAIPDGTAERKALDTLLRLTSEMDEDSWIFIGDAQIREKKMLRQSFFERRRPIVFLNMCQSADLLPSMSTGFVRLFLDKNASAVIGTESPMTAVFASAYAEQVLDALFAGETLGTALLRARRHFLQAELRNPLGLAYTLYGRASTKLGASPLTQVRKAELTVGSPNGAGSHG